MKKRFFKISITLLILISVGVAFVINNVLLYAIIQPKRVTTTNYLDVANQDYNTITVLTKDSLLLKGYHVKSNRDTTYASIVLIHGIGGCKEHFTNLAVDLAHAGYESWIFDNRAHGESEGTYSTYGYHEKDDISKIIDNIKKLSPESKIGLWGNSLGGAIAIQAIEKDSRIDFGIIESTFTDLSLIVQDYQKRFSYGLEFKWVCNLTLNKASEIARFIPSQVKPLASVKHINKPMLIAHGDADQNIKYEYGKTLFNNLASTDKTFVTVAGGDHYNMTAVGGAEYRNKLFSFLKSKTQK